MIELTDADWDAIGRLAKEFCINMNDAEECYRAGLAAGIERCAHWCEKNKGTACAEHCSVAVRALLK